MVKESQYPWLTTMTVRLMSQERSFFPSKLEKANRQIHTQSTANPALMTTWTKLRPMVVILLTYRHRKMVNSQGPGLKLGVLQHLTQKANTPSSHGLKKFRLFTEHISVEENICIIQA